MKNKKNCIYFSSSGNKCYDLVEDNSEYCYWHCPNIDKKNVFLTKKLEERASSGQIMEGFQLKGALLEDLNLYDGSEISKQLLNSNLNRANLTRAHLYAVNLKGCNFLKANFTKANLHAACLEDCDLLGANFKEAKLEGVTWGKQIKQEKEGYKAKSKIKAYKLFKEAEEIMRSIRCQYEKQGVFTHSSHFFYKEMLMRHQQYSKYSYNRFLSKIIDLISGYGEKPMRVVIFSFVLVMIFSLLFLFTGIRVNDIILDYQGKQNFFYNWNIWLNCFYYSIVTFTTLGYGDITPVGVSKFFAAMEAFIGSFSIALFVVLFVKKMTR